MCIVAFIEEHINKIILFPRIVRLICMTQKKIHASKLGHKLILSFRSLQKVTKLFIQKLFQHHFLTV